MGICDLCKSGVIGINMVIYDNIFDVDLSDHREYPTIQDQLPGRGDP